MGQGPSPDIHFDRGTPPAGEQWPQNRQLPRDAGVGALSLAVGVLVLFGLLLALGDLTGMDLQDAVILAGLLLAGPALPVAYGVVRLGRAARAPRRFTSDAEWVRLRFARRTASLRKAAVVSVGTQVRVVGGSLLEVRTAGGDRLRVVGLDPRAMEGFVSELEAASPAARCDPWALTVGPGGVRTVDARHAQAVGQPITPPRGVWITPTAAYAAFQKGPLARLVALLAAITGQRVSLFVLEAWESWEALAGGLALIFVPVFLPGFLLALRFRRPTGVSVMIMPEGPDRFGEATTAVELAFSKTGMAVPGAATRRRLGARRARWKTREGVRVELSVSLTATQTRLHVRTPDAELADTHARIKGAIAAELASGRGPPAGSEVDAPVQHPPSGPAPAAPWKESLLPDGRRVPDSAWVSDISRGIEEAPGWMSRSRETDRRVFLIAFPALAALLVLPPLMAGLSFGAPAETVVLVAVALEAAVMVPMAWYAYPIARGQAAVALLTVPRHLNDLAVMERVGRAIKRHGQPVAVSKHTAVWYVWKLEGGVRIRYVKNDGNPPDRLLISARGGMAHASYLRLKGYILDEFGLVAAAPPAGPPTAHP